MKNFFYRVNKNDTVLSVSIKFGIPFNEIIKENGLKEEIEEGDLLYLKREEGETYIPLPNESISDVSEKFGIAKERLKEKNGTDYLFPFGVIRL